MPSRHVSIKSPDTHRRQRDQGPGTSDLGPETFMWVHPLHCSGAAGGNWSDVIWTTVAGEWRGVAQFALCPFDGTHWEHNVDVTIKRRTVKLLCTIRINDIYIICSCAFAMCVCVCEGGCGCGRCCLHRRIKPTKQQRKHTLVLATRTNSCCNMIELSICCPFSVATSHLPCCPTTSILNPQQRAQKGGTNVQQISVHCHVVCPAHRSTSLSLSVMRVHLPH